MKKSSSKLQLKTDTPPKTPLMTTSNYSSQQKQQLTDSSLVQMGSSNYKNYQNSANINSEFNQKTNQLQKQNGQVNEENWIQKQKQLNNIIKQICDPNQNLNETNNEHLQNLNIPPLTFVSASKTSISQKKRYPNQENPQSKEYLKLNRAGSLEYNNFQNKGQVQTPSNKNQQITKKNSLARLDSLPQTHNQKNKQKVSTPSQQQNGNNLNNSQQRRLSVYDLNIIKNKQNQSNNDQQQNQYFSVNNNHFNCILPQRSDSKSNSYSQIPNFERGESSSSAKKSSKKNGGNLNSTNAQSPTQSKLPQVDSQQSNNQFNNQIVDKKLLNQGSSSTTYSLNSNGAAVQNFYSQVNHNSIMSSQNISSNNQNSQINSQQNPPYISQTTSYCSNGNNNNNNNNNNKETQSFIMNEKMINNETKNKFNQEEQKVVTLEKQNEELRDNCKSLEKENEQLRRILSEQEQVMSKMKNLYSSIGNDDSNYKSNHPSDQNFNSNQIISQSDNLTKEIYAKYEFENNQLRLKNQEFSIRIKVLQENVRDLEYKCKDYQSDINNLIEVKKQLEIDLIQVKGSLEQKQQIIEEIIKQREQEENLNKQNTQTEEKIKRTKIQDYESSQHTNNLVSTQKNSSIENYQVIQSIPVHPAATITPLVNEFDKKMEQENQSLLYKIEDLECQLQQVYKSLNSSPSKSMQNLDVYPDNRLLFLGASSEQIIHGNVDSQQQMNSQFYSFEQFKQLIIEVENLKKVLKDQQDQLILWQERYNNLEIVHQSLITEKASNFLEPNNPDQGIKEQLKDQVQSLQTQIDNLNLVNKDQGNEITFLKMTVQQKNIEIQDYQIKLESKETASQMIKKRMQDLEEESIQAYSQKGQLKVQVKQLQELFENQKTELNNVYQLLKTRSQDLSTTQKQVEDFQNLNRKQQITIQIYEKEMDELVTKNNKLQNQIYGLLNQNAQSNTNNFLLNQQKELSQNLLQKLNLQLKSNNSESNFNSNIQFNTQQSNSGFQFNFPVVNSYDYPIQQMQQNQNQQIQIINSFENPTFANLNTQNTAKNLNSENQLSKESYQAQNQLSFQNQNNYNQQQEQSYQLPPMQSSSQNLHNQNNRISNFSDFELTKSKIDDNFITQASNTNEKSVYISQ